MQLFQNLGFSNNFTEITNQAGMTVAVMGILYMHIILHIIFWQWFNTWNIINMYQNYSIFTKLQQCFPWQSKQAAFEIC